MVQVVPAHFSATQQVILATVDNIQSDANLLHHRGTRAPEIVRRPFAICAVTQYQRVVMAASCEWLAAILELHLPVAYTFGDAFEVDVAGIVGCREKKGCGASEGVQFLELTQGEGRQENVMVLSLSAMSFGVLGWEKPRSFSNIDVTPFGLE